MSGKKLTPEEKLAQFRSNARSMTTPKHPVVKSAPTPTLHNNPPALGKALAVGRHNALLKSNPPVPSQAPPAKKTVMPKEDFAKAAAKRLTDPFNRVASRDRSR